MSMLQTILSVIISASTVLGIFTGIINKLFSNKLNPIKKEIEKNRLDSVKEDMRIARYQVVKFASELHKGQSKTRFEFEAIAELADTYEKAVQELGIKNSFFEEEEQYIKECYHKLCNNENK